MRIFNFIDIPSDTVIGSVITDRSDNHDRFSITELRDITSLLESRGFTLTVGEVDMSKLIKQACKCLTLLEEYGYEDLSIRKIRYVPGIGARRINIDFEVGVSYDDDIAR